MKSYLLFSCLLLFVMQQAVAQNIRFESGAWKDVLQKADSSHKIVFVDIYAVWCGPCKAMAKKVFTQTAVANQFNEHFISYMADAEKGEGVALAKKYTVTSFPTYLFVDSKGKLLHRVEGVRTADEFIAESNKALGK